MRIYYFEALLSLEESVSGWYFALEKTNCVILEVVEISHVSDVFRVCLEHLVLLDVILLSVPFLNLLVKHFTIQQGPSRQDTSFI